MRTPAQILQEAKACQMKSGRHHVFLGELSASPLQLGKPFLRLFVISDQTFYVLSSFLQKNSSRFVDDLLDDFRMKRKMAGEEIEVFPLRRFPRPGSQIGIILFELSDIAVEVRFVRRIDDRYGIGDIRERLKVTF